MRPSRRIRLAYFAGSFCSFRLLLRKRNQLEDHLARVASWNVIDYGIALELPLGIFSEVQICKLRHICQVTTGFDSTLPTIDGPDFEKADTKSCSQTRSDDTAQIIHEQQQQQQQQQEPLERATR